ncbi:23S rRNA pseudouridine(955/2504/2580) synthase RluC [Methylothermus subterraneus]
MIEQTEKTAPKLVTVEAEDQGQRIDNFLIAHLKGVPKSHLYRLLRTGQVRVNGGRVKAPYRLQAGDRIRLPPLALAPARELASPAARAMGRRLENRFLYEDAWLLAIAKPAGMPVHGGSGLTGGVIEGLRLVRPEAERWELVHRLDKDTSGCLLIAKRKGVLRSLHQALRAGQMDKRYLALLAGVWKEEQRLVEVPLRKFVLPGGERYVRADPQGKPARTEFVKLAQLAEATLVEARLLTGRTHQIRVHAAWMGHPILGDARYGEEAVNAAWRGQGLKRMFLHAWKLALLHPITGARLELEAPLEAELIKLLTRAGYYEKF